MERRLRKYLVEIKLPKDSFPRITVKEAKRNLLRLNKSKDEGDFSLKRKEKYLR